MRGGVRSLSSGRVNKILTAPFEVGELGARASACGGTWSLLPGPKLPGQVA